MPEPTTSTTAARHPPRSPHRGPARPVPVAADPTAAGPRPPGRPTRQRGPRQQVRPGTVQPRESRRTRRPANPVQGGDQQHGHGGGTVHPASLGLERSRPSAAPSRVPAGMSYRTQSSRHQHCPHRRRRCHPIRPDQATEPGLRTNRHLPRGAGPDRRSPASRANQDGANRKTGVDRDPSAVRTARRQRLATPAARCHPGRPGPWLGRVGSSASSPIRPTSSRTSSARVTSCAPWRSSMTTHRGQRGHRPGHRAHHPAQLDRAHAAVLARTAADAGLDDHGGPNSAPRPTDCGSGSGGAPAGPRADTR